MKFTFTTTPGQEFVGFLVGSSDDDCRIDRLATYYRPIVCSAASSIILDAPKDKN